MVNEEGPEPSARREERILVNICSQVMGVGMESYKTEKYSCQENSPTLSLSPIVIRVST